MTDSRDTSDASEAGDLHRPPAEVEAAIRGASEDADRARGALVLAAIANRATAALNTLARNEANARRGADDWGTWASLANAARDAVLKIATCRKAATNLVRAAGPPPAA